MDLPAVVVLQGEPGRFQDPPHPFLAFGDLASEAMGHQKIQGQDGGAVGNVVLLTVDGLILSGDIVALSPVPVLAL